MIIDCLSLHVVLDLQCPSLKLKYNLRAYILKCMRYSYYEVDQQLLCSQICTSRKVVGTKGYVEVRVKIWLRVDVFLAKTVDVITIKMKVGLPTRLHLKQEQGRIKCNVH